MEGAQSALVLCPRFTSLVGTVEFTSTGIDVSSFGSAQLEIWRGILVGDTGSTFRVYLEESLDGVIWQPPAASAEGHDPGAEKSIVLSHVFNLRWFRVRIKLTKPLISTTEPLVTCWVEGMLR